MSGRRRDIAGALMALATRAAPSERRDWAGAMQAEFTALERGRLSWALGCLTTSLRWRAPGEAVYAAALAGSVFFVSTIASFLLIEAMVFGLISLDAMFALQAPVAVVAHLGLGGLLGFQRPDRRLVTALALGVGPLLVGLASIDGFHHLGRVDPGTALQWAGALTMLALGYAAATLGARLRRFAA
ncbi:hypothetical protein [Caulobacter hibisci]|uniref:Uncharacterized protein n=1 Tax=Caulobacter hibisci TaxID=2035993 RepID=A0ABS0T7P3_9CAUL|nr:hypothetical protein [Caulobacter hibisci]MBI1686872.1 hypothetical protein [Caulobacter hibisci]